MIIPYEQMNDLLWQKYRENNTLTEDQMHQIAWRVRAECKPLIKSEPIGIDQCEWIAYLEHEHIAYLAGRIYEMRGGSDMDNWLEAESIMRPFICYMCSMRWWDWYHHNNGRCADAELAQRNYSSPDDGEHCA